MIANNGLIQCRHNIRISTLYIALYLDLLDRLSDWLLEFYIPATSRYQLVTVRTHGDLIVLSHWEISHQDPLSHIILTLS